MEPEKLRYAVKHAQHALDIGNTKFWAAVRDGKIKVQYDGPRAYVTRDELQRYINDCQQRAPAAQAQR